MPKEKSFGHELDAEHGNMKNPLRILLPFVLFLCDCFGSFPLPAGANEWGPVQNGLKTRLIPLEEQYVLGEEMNFRLEMTNAGDSAKKFDAQGVDINNSILIIGPDGSSLPYTAGSHQTVGSSKPLHPGETVILFDTLNLWSQYYFHDSGRHKVTFRGRRGVFGNVPIPPSNTISIDVLSSSSEIISNVIFGRLLKIFPEVWDLSMWPRTKGLESEVIPTGREPAKGIHFSITTLIPEGFVDKGDFIISSIWLVDSKVDPSKKDFRYLSNYLGKNPWGHVYIHIPKKVEGVWPGMRNEIIEAMEIETEQ